MKFYPDLSILEPYFKKKQLLCGGERKDLIKLDSVLDGTFMTNRRIK